MLEFMQDDGYDKNETNSFGYLIMKISSDLVLWLHKRTEAPIPHNENALTRKSVVRNSPPPHHQSHWRTPMKTFGHLRSRVDEALVELTVNVGTDQLDRVGLDAVHPLATMTLDTLPTRDMIQAKNRPRMKN